MAISDAQFEAWLKSAANERRVVLVEAKAYTGGVEVTRYMASKGFVSTPTDAPANQVYDGIVKEVPYFTCGIPEAFGGKSLAGWGDLVVSNEGGLRDSWLGDAWDGRALTLYLGDAGWPKSDFRTILVGVTADIVSKDRTALVLRMRDKSWMLNVALQESLIGGATANTDKLRPLAYGEVFNVEPALITGATHEYQVHDGAINDITDIRDNGVSLAGAYIKNIATGKPTLNAAPAGRITADVQGAKPGGIYITRCADIIKEIVTTRTQLTAGDLDVAGTFTSMNVTCPQKLGLFAPTYRTVAQACDELVKAVGGYWTFDLAGKMVLGRLDAPAGTAALDLTADDIQLRGLSIKGRFLPINTLRLGYRRNYSVQLDGLAGAVTEANRALYAKEHQAVKATNAGISAIHKLAENPELEGTLLVDAVEAQTEVNRRATLWNTIRFVYEVQAYLAPYKLRLGQVINVYNDRFGFAAGKLCTLVGYTWYPSKRRAVLQLFA